MLNEVAERLEKKEKERAKEKDDSVAGTPNGTPMSDDSIHHPTGSSERDNEEQQPAKYQCKTWIHTIFEGVLTNDTRCLTCETVAFHDPRSDPTESARPLAPLCTTQLQHPP